MKVYVEVTWDNGIDGEDVICIGEIDNNFNLEDILKSYFGNNVEIIDNTTVLTKRGKLTYCLGL